MSEQLQSQEIQVRPLDEVLKKVEQAVKAERIANQDKILTVKDLRWQFDQVSAVMNQAVYNNEEQAKIHDSCLKTVAILIEILSRS